MPIGVEPIVTIGNSLNCGTVSARPACPVVAPALLGVAMMFATNPPCTCADVASEETYVSCEVGDANVATLGAGENSTDGALLERFIVTALPVASNQPPTIVLPSASLAEMVID